MDASVGALKANEVSLSSKQKNKWKLEDNDDYSPNSKRQSHMVDMGAGNPETSLFKKVLGLQLVEQVRDSWLKKAHLVI